MTDAVSMIGPLDAAVEAVLAKYDFSPRVTFKLFNVSENSTYRIDDPETGKAFALRVHRPNYHSLEEIESELMWIDELREKAEINAPSPVASCDGTRVQTIDINEGRSTRYVSVFDWLSGEAPSAENDLTKSFGLLGGLAAKMHLHGVSWARPENFKRFTYDDNAVFTKRLWGRWEDAPGISVAEHKTLSRVEAEIRKRLAEYGRESDRFGLAHNDLRLANLLVDGDSLSVIDFDDCGMSWFLNDFATGVSFMEDDPRVGDWMEAWVEAYTRHRPLSQVDRNIMPTLIMLRRMLLLSWVGFHYEHAPEARELGGTYAAGSCPIGEQYLSGRYLV